MAAGPFGSPDRWKAAPGAKQVPGNWERSIGLYRTSDTYVVQSRSWSHVDIGAVLWFAPASSLGSVFTPFLVHLTNIPSSFRSGHQSHFDRQSAFWAACFLHNIANLKWSYAIQDIQRSQAQLEHASVAMVQRMDQLSMIHQQQSTTTTTIHPNIHKTVETHYLQNAEQIVASLWSLSDQIMFKYASGFLNEQPPAAGGMSQTVGYPKWWLEQVGYADGPPPPPTKPKCCNPQPATSSSSFTESSSLRKQQAVTLPTGPSTMKYSFELQ